MFEALGEKLDEVLRRVRGHTKLTENNVEEALREVRLALLEADVNFRVVKEFTEKIKTEALGEDVLKSLSPGQQLVKIVNQELVNLLGGEQAELDLSFPSPVKILLVGLNGSGKTTTAAKLARHLKVEKKRRPYLVPADTFRPAAVEQLKRLGNEIDVPVFPTLISSQQSAVSVAQAGIEEARKSGSDIVVVDTAGRLQVDNELMEDLERLKTVVQPHLTLLIADAMTGQQAVEVAAGFHNRIAIDGIILTKIEGDARGGAALSLRSVIGKPIFFAGTGEKLDALEPFHPDRIASRILGMGDVLSLVEKAEKVYDQEQAEQLEKKFKKNQFTLEDFQDQMRMVKKMGSITDLVTLIPGAKKMVGGTDMEGAEKQFKRVEAIVGSMTKAEKKKPELLNGSRRKRIAKGSGTSVAEVNRFLKQYLGAKKMMRRLSGAGGGKKLKKRLSLPAWGN